MLSLSLVRLMLSVEVGVTTAMSGDRRSRNFYDIKERTVQGVREVLQKSLRQPINLSLEPIGNGVNYCTQTGIPQTAMKRKS